MTADLQLFRVTVTQEWTAEADALVWASSKAEAEKAAELEVELDVDDADADCWAGARPEPIENLQRLTKRDAAELWLIGPDGNEIDDLEDFIAVFSKEDLEAIRLRKIEADNGQLALLEVAA